MAKKKSKRGGARQGAGRPKSETQSIKRDFRQHVDLWARYDALADKYNVTSAELLRLLVAKGEKVKLD